MKVQATTTGGIYEVEEFDDFVDILDYDDFVYEIDFYFIGWIGCELTAEQVTALENEYGIERFDNYGRPIMGHIPYENGGGTK